MYVYTECMYTLYVCIHCMYVYTECMYTLSGMNYWEVDLGRVYNIDHIMVYGRSDAEQNWLNGAAVS